MSLEIYLQWVPLKTFMQSLQCCLYGYLLWNGLIMERPSVKPFVGWLSRNPFANCSHGMAFMQSLYGNLSSNGLVK